MKNELSDLQKIDIYRMACQETELFPDETILEHTKRVIETYEIFTLRLSTNLNQAT